MLSIHPSQDLAVNRRLGAQQRLTGARHATRWRRSGAKRRRRGGEKGVSNSYPLQAAEFLHETRFFPALVYTFKHVLVQEVAYQSLLADVRQQLHQRTAHTLAARFAAIVDIQPELVAHHYTEAGLIEQAILYWQRAGQQALQHSANPEAIQHLTRGLELLATLPATPARAQQELDLRVALGPALMATKGQAAPEVEHTYARARVLCAQIGETPQLIPTLRGLCRFYQSRGPLPTARELGEQLYRLAQHTSSPIPHLEALDALGSTLSFLGDYPAAWLHLDRESPSSTRRRSSPWC